MIGTHPHPEQLAAFRLGKLGDDELAEIESHIGQCDSCCRSLKELPDDSFVNLVRQATDSTFAAESSASISAADQGQKTWDQGDTLSNGPEAEVPSDLRDHPRYQIMEKLGQGGMGVVYKARHRLMDRVVALKVLHPNLVDKPASIARFQREWKGAARLVHPHIVTAYDAEQAGSSHFLVMEFVPGISLARLVEQQGPLSVQQACSFIRHAALGLQHAFECGMVHRDIKPQNLMVTNMETGARSASEECSPPSLARRAPNEIVKILDFGLARFVSETVGELPSSAQQGDPDSRLTQASTVMGTPEYIAPEQAQSAAAADIRADIYSLGCTLYFLMAGHAPFPRGSALQKIKAHHEEMPKSLSEIRSDVPPELVEVMNRMLAKDPTQRFQTPAEVAEALASFLPSETPSVTTQASGNKKRYIPFPRFSFAASILLLFGLLLYLFVPPVQDLVQTVVRLAMNKGVLIIEANDEDLEITIKQGGKEVVKAVVVDKKTKRTFELTAEQGEILVRGKDSTFWARKFELQRGERVIFSAQALVDPQFAKHIIPFIEDQGIYVAPKERQVAAGEPTTLDLGIIKHRPVRDVADAIDQWLKENGWNRPDVSVAATSDLLQNSLRVQVICPDKALPEQISKLVKKLDDPKAERDFLQGHWMLIKEEENGQVIPRETIEKTKPFHFSGDWIRFSRDNNNCEGIFKLDPDKNPKWIDIKWVQGNRGFVRGIYQIDFHARQLKLCLGGPEDPRPEGFNVPFKGMKVQNLILGWTPHPLAKTTKLDFGVLKHVRADEAADAINKWQRDNGWSRPDVTVAIVADKLKNTLHVDVTCPDKTLAEEIRKLIEQLDKAPGDADKIKGRWVILVSEFEGKKLPADQFKNVEIRFGDKDVEIILPGPKQPRVLRGTYEIDPEKKQIRIHFKEQKSALRDSWSYRWEEARLTIEMKAHVFGNSPEATAKKIETAIKQLGSVDFKEREAAERELVSLGSAAYPALEQLVKSGDPETRKRAQDAIKKIKANPPRDLRLKLERRGQDSPPPEPAFQPLFNGKDLAGWKGDAKDWKVEDKVLLFHGKFASPLQTQKVFENYILRFEHWVEPGGSKLPGFTVVLHEATAEEAKIKERDGPRVDFHQGGGGQYGLFDYKGRPLEPLRTFQDKNARPNGWNKVEIHNVGGQIDVLCNGQPMATFKSEKARSGTISLRPFGSEWRGEWSFRNIEIRELPAGAEPPRGGFRPLFPAKNMTGWKGQTQSCTWAAEDLKIVKTSGPSYTYVWTEKKLRDYELKFQLKFPQVNSYFGVQPRRKNTTDPLARGEVVAMHLEYLRLGEGAKEPVPQGPASPRFKRGQEFNDILIRCIGKRINVQVNGETVRDEEVTELPVEGALTFCVASIFDTPEAVLRNIQIRELPSERPD